LTRLAPDPRFPR